MDLTRNEGYFNYPDSFHVDAVLYKLKAYLSSSNCFAVSASEVILEGVSCYSIEIRAEYIQDTDAWSCMKLVFSNGIWNYNEKSGKAYFENECSVKLTSQDRLFFHGSKREEDILRSLMQTPLFQICRLI